MAREIEGKEWELTRDQREMEALDEANRRLADEAEQDRREGSVRIYGSTSTTDLLLFGCRLARRETAQCQSFHCAQNCDGRN